MAVENQEKCPARASSVKSTSEKPAPHNDYNQLSTALFQNLDKVLTGAVKTPSPRLSTESHCALLRRLLADW